jgi:tetratricopeptide (TPR) repeat protein
LVGLRLGLCFGLASAPMSPLLRVAAAAPAARAATAPPAASPAPATPTTPPPADTGETDKMLAEAREHFDAGTRNYAAGRYEDAIKDFQAGYALVPRPNFLVNIGQAYRKLGNLERAKEAYLAYVRALPENSAWRDQAMQVLAEIEVQLQDRAARGGAAPAAATSRPTAAAPATKTELPPAATPAGAWLGLGVAGAGLALVATGAVFQLRAKNASDSLAEASRMGQPFDPDREQVGKRSQRVGNGLLAAGGAVMAAGLLLFLVLDATREAGRAGGPRELAVGPDGVALGWRF